MYTEREALVGPANMAVEPGDQVYKGEKTLRHVRGPACLGQHS